MSKNEASQVGGNQDRSTLDVLLSHRTVRAFTDRPLDAGVLETLVHAGTRASTSSSMQAYTVIAIADPTHKKHLAELSADQPQIHQAAAFLIFCADLHKLGLACKLNGKDDTELGRAEALIAAVVDVALVLENVSIAAESLGLGICMIGAVRNNPYEISTALRLPRRVVAVSGLCIGYPAEAGETKPRLPIEAVLHYDHYRRDDELVAQIRRYDETQAEWYKERDMHRKDPRWSSVMGQRVSGFAKREPVGRYLRENGFWTR